MLSIRSQIQYLRILWFHFYNSVCMGVQSLQRFLTLCDPLGCSPPGSSVHGILQARIQEWVATPSSRGILLDPGIELESLTSPVLTGRFFTTNATQEAPFPGHISRQNSNPKGYVHTNVNSSTTHNSQDTEASTSTDTHEWIKKMWHIYTTECYSAINRNTLGPILMRWTNQRLLYRVK